MSKLLTFFLVTGGAFIIWLLKGMRSKFTDEASGQFDNDFKYYRNLLVGILLLVILFLVLESLLN